MTDARLPERWLNDRRFLRISAEAFRAYSFALMWSVSNRTDGLLLADDLDDIPKATEDKIRELLSFELLTVSTEPAGWRLVDFEDTQTSAAQLEAAAEARREKDRNRKRGARASLKPSGAVSADSPRTIRGGSLGQDTTGQDRRLEASYTQGGTHLHDLAQRTEVSGVEVEDWPLVSEHLRTPDRNERPIEESW